MLKNGLIWQRHAVVPKSNKKTGHRSPVQAGLGALALIGWFILWLIPAPTAQAHSLLITANPAPGAVLKAAPKTLQLRFTHSLNLELSRTTVWDDNQNSLATGPAHFFRGDDTQLEIPLKPYQGRYNVIWTAVSRSDGHVYKDSFFFTVDPLLSTQATSFSSLSDPVVQQLVDQINHSHQHGEGLEDLFHLVNSNVAANSIVEQAPASLVLEFNLPLDPQISQVIVWDRERHILHSGESKIDQLNPARLTVGLKLASGPYIVVYFVAPAPDSPEHQLIGFIHGVFVFKVDPSTVATSDTLAVNKALLSQEAARFETHLGLLQQVAK